jgi:hypothetical protein
MDGRQDHSLGPQVSAKKKIERTNFKKSLKADSVSDHSLAPQVVVFVSF